MERSIIVKEYFLLRNLLNQGNKLANQESNLKFSIEQYSLSEYRLYAVVSGPNETLRIALAERSITKVWERSGFTKFRFFESYCANFLNTYEKTTKPPLDTKILPEYFLISGSHAIQLKFSSLLLAELS